MTEPVLKRVVNGITVGTPPGFKPYAGQPSGRGFVLDGDSLVMWADVERPFYQATRALDFDLLDMTRFHGSFDITTSRVFCHPDDFKPTAERLLRTAFPDLEFDPDWPFAREPLISIAGLSASIEPARAAAIWTALREANFAPVEPAPGWQVNPVDPEAVVNVTPGVRLKDGFRLVSYRYGFPGGWGAFGVTYAVPGESIEHPVLSSEREAVPRPSSASNSLEAALIPEGGCESWFARSLLIRELRETGAYWHGVRWHTHEPCFSSEQAVTYTSTDEWSWDDSTEAWPPSVTVLPLIVTVCFATFSRFVRGTLYQHLDEHNVSRGEIDISETQLGSGGRGYIM